MKKRSEWYEITRSLARGQVRVLLLYSDSQMFWYRPHRHDHQGPGSCGKVEPLARACKVFSGRPEAVPPVGRKSPLHASTIDERTQTNAGHDASKDHCLIGGRAGTKIGTLAALLGLPRWRTTLGYSEACDGPHHIPSHGFSSSARGRSWPEDQNQR